MVTEIHAYRTKDGQEFITYEEALQHETECLLRSRVVYTAFGINTTAFLDDLELCEKIAQWYEHQTLPAALQSPEEEGGDFEDLEPRSMSSKGTAIIALTLDERQDMAEDLFEENIYNPELIHLIIAWADQRGLL